MNKITKAFGKFLHQFKREGSMWDFNQFGIVREDYGGSILNYAVESTAVEQSYKKGKKKKEKKVKELTPKQIYKAEALNDKEFSFDTSVEYVEKQIKLLNKKQSFFPKPRKQRRGQYDEPTSMVFGPIKHGKAEIDSIIERLQNRTKITKSVEKVMNTYPHTTNTLINKVLKDNKHLSFRAVDSFVPDLPEDAIDAIEEYNEMCLEVCGKKTHFYLIANKEDFQKVNERRDPILLAQSPFGFFWQILGAWDEEMIYLGDL